MVQWDGAAVKEGCRGSRLARSRAEARRTGDGGSAATHDGEGDGAGVPANARVQNLVSEVRNATGG